MYPAHGTVILYEQLQCAHGRLQSYKAEQVQSQLELLLSKHNDVIRKLLSNQLTGYQHKYCYLERLNHRGQSRELNESK